MRSTDAPERKVGSDRVDLRVAAESLQTLLQALPMAVVARDAAGKITLWNAAAEQLFGWSQSKMLKNDGRLTAQAWPEWDGVERKIARGQTVVGAEAKLPRRDGGSIEVLVFAAPQRDSTGKVSGSISLFEDVSERVRQQETRLAEVTRQRDLLIREVHHRVKNHLQGLAGLLRQHSEQEKQGRPVLESAINQILSIAGAYGLQGRSRAGAVLLDELIQTIALSPAGFAEVALAGLQAASGVQIEEREAVPLALILNELLTNAIKHASPGRARILIDIAIDAGVQRACIAIRNPGRLPAGFKLAAGGGIGTGLGLVLALLPAKGAALRMASAGGQPPEVEARVELGAPVLRFPM